MKKAFLLLIVLVWLLSGCSLLFPPKYTVQLGISLGPSSSYPSQAEYAVTEAADLIKYGGKNVVFSVVGIDAVNDTVNLVGVSELGWTGGDASSSTQYATYPFDLDADTEYQGGRYKFRIYIDWNDSSSLDSGDLVLDSYSVLADKDSDPDTQALLVETAEYGTAITYNASDYSITIDDPLSVDTGLQWVITDIGEGPLLVYP
jgi:hypothetical protein